MNVSLKAVILAFVVAACLQPAEPLLAAEPTLYNQIQGGHSATWYDSTQPGHGLFVEVLSDSKSPTGKKLVVSWFAFFDGMQVWLLAQGEVIDTEDGQEAVLDVVIYEGNDFPPSYDPDLTESTKWGTMLLSFIGCDLAHLEWDSVIEGFGTGELELQRLSTIAGSFCNPNQGGSDGDDHGDTWQTGTILADMSGNTNTISGSLEERGDVDVFVFTLSTSAKLIFYTHASQGTDSVGVLYEIEGSIEDEIDEYDEHPSNDAGFWIEETLIAGKYSVHVKGATESERGDYHLYYRAE